MFLTLLGLIGDDGYLGLSTTCTLPLGIYCDDSEISSLLIASKTFTPSSIVCEL